jgi:hypothetical protein
MEKQFTLEEFNTALNAPIKYPDPEDCKDRGYFIKYAHTLPPLTCYRMRPPHYQLTCTENDLNNRKVYYGWNNLTPFEESAIEQIKNKMS